MKKLKQLEKLSRSDEHSILKFQVLPNLLFLFGEQKKIVNFSSN
jgi:hypothetical protein